jgi:hypothetical protein
MAVRGGRKAARSGNLSGNDGAPARSVLVPNGTPGRPGVSVPFLPVLESHAACERKTLFTSEKTILTLGKTISTLENSVSTLDFSVSTIVFSPGTFVFPFRL